MARGSAVRGSGIGAGPLGESGQGVAVERVAVTFWRADGDSSPSTFAAATKSPLTWYCHSCGRPAGLDRDDLPPPACPTPSKNHLAYVRDRRTDTDTDTDKILSEALAQLRAAC